MGTAPSLGGTAGDFSAAMLGDAGAVRGASGDMGAEGASAAIVAAGEERWDNKPLPRGTVSADRRKSGVPKTTSAVPGSEGVGSGGPSTPDGVAAGPMEGGSTGAPIARSKGGAIGGPNMPEGLAGCGVTGTGPGLPGGCARTAGMTRFGMGIGGGPMHIGMHGGTIGEPARGTTGDPGRSTAPVGEPGIEPGELFRLGGKLVGTVGRRSKVAGGCNAAAP